MLVARTQNARMRNPVGSRSLATTEASDPFVLQYNFEWLFTIIWYGFFLIFLFH